MLVVLSLPFFTPLYQLFIKVLCDVIRCAMQARIAGNLTDSSMVFSVDEARLTDVGLYRCVVEDVSGQQWNDTAVLSVNGPLLALSINQSISLFCHTQTQFIVISAYE